MDYKIRNTVAKNSLNEEKFYLIKVNFIIIR